MQSCDITELCVPRSARFSLLPILTLNTYIYIYTQIFPTILDTRKETLQATGHQHFHYFSSQVDFFREEQDLQMMEGNLSKQNKTYKLVHFRASVEFKCRKLICSFPSSISRCYWWHLRSHSLCTPNNLLKCAPFGIISMKLNYKVH